MSKSEVHTSGAIQYIYNIFYNITDYFSIKLKHCTDSLTIGYKNLKYLGRKFLSLPIMSQILTILFFIIIIAVFTPLYLYVHDHAWIALQLLHQSIENKQWDVMWKYFYSYIYLLCAQLSIFPIFSLMIDYFRYVWNATLNDQFIKENYPNLSNNPEPNNLPKFYEYNKLIPDMIINLGLLIFYYMPTTIIQMYRLFIHQPYLIYPIAIIVLSLSAVQCLLAYLESLFIQEDKGLAMWHMIAKDSNNILSAQSYGSPKNDYYLKALNASNQKQSLSHILLSGIQSCRMFIMQLMHNIPEPFYIIIQIPAYLMQKITYQALIQNIPKITNLISSVHSLGHQLSSIYKYQMNISSLRENSEKILHNKKLKKEKITINPLKNDNIVFHSQGELETNNKKRNLELRVIPGKNIHLVGNNGVGKTQMARAIHGNFPCNKNLTLSIEKSSNVDMFYLPSTSFHYTMVPEHIFYPHAPNAENLELFVKFIRGVYNNEEEYKDSAHFNIVENLTTSIKNSKNSANSNLTPLQLSSGEGQILNAASFYIALEQHKKHAENRKKCVILDESYSNIDISKQKSFMKLIESTLKEGDAITCIQHVAKMECSENFERVEILSPASS